MERNSQNIGLTNWLTLLILGVVSALVARYAGSATGAAAVVVFGLGVLVAAVSYFQMRLDERERLERLEFEELKKTRGGSELFAATEADTFAARRSREQFEKIFVPAFTFVLFALQGGAAWWLWKWLEKATPPKLEAATISMALYGLFALILFLLGKYSANLARLDEQRLLRPAAGYLMLSAAVCCLVATTQIAVWSGFAKADVYAARGLCVLLAMAAVEMLVGLVFEVYRPRVKGQEARLLYESRLIGLLGRPRGLVTTAAQALDYQFGFKVSETWFYRFLERAIAWIILLQLGVLSLSTAFVVIEPGEQGLLERLGRPVAGRTVLDPGLHFKWPWPIDQVYRHPTKQLRSFNVGVVADPEMDKERTVLWTRPHYKEEINMLVASPEQAARADVSAGEKPVPANLLVVSIPVQYRVTDLTAWAYNRADAGKLLEELANREVVRYLVSVDMDNIMSRGRLAAAEAIRERVQARANDLKLGVEIVFVGLQDIHPPVGNDRTPVAAAFEEVVGARQRMETNRLGALAYEAEKLPSAQGEATNILVRARSDRATKISMATAEAAQFNSRIVADQAAPTVYRHRLYLDTLARAAGEVPKYIIAATNTSDVVQLDLQERIRDDLLRNAILPPDVSKPAEVKR